jgi:hypothetical protein
MIINIEQIIEILFILISLESHKYMKKKGLLSGQKMVTYICENGREPKLGRARE